MKNYKDMIYELAGDDSDSMSEWETNYIEDLVSVFEADHDYVLTEKQITKVDEIWERVFG